MNRRDLITGGWRALFGVPAALLGVDAVKGAPPQVTIVLRPDGEVFRKAVTDAVFGDIRAGGKIREIIINNHEVGR